MTVAKGSVTALIDFHDCPRKWAFRHSLRLEPARRPHNLASGTAVHAAIGETLKRIAGGQPADKAIAHMHDTLAELLLFREFAGDDKATERVAKYLPGVQRALKQCPEWLWGSAWHVEEDLSLPVATVGSGLVLTGRPDLYRTLLSEEGDLVVELVEIKTTDNPPLDYLLWNPQHRYYAVMLQALYPTALVRFRYLCLPTQGKAKDHIPWALTDKLYETTVRELTHRCCLLLQSMGRMALEQPNYGSRCKWCDFAPLCQTQLTGGSLESAIDSEFVHRPPRPVDKPTVGVV